MKTKSIEHTELNAIPSLLLLRCNTFMHIYAPFQCIGNIAVSLSETAHEKRNQRKKKHWFNFTLWMGLSEWIFSFDSKQMLNCANSCCVTNSGKSMHYNDTESSRSGLITSLNFVIFFFSRWCFPWNSYAHIIIMSNKRRKNKNPTTSCTQPLLQFSFFFRKMCPALLWTENKHGFLS